MKLDKQLFVESSDAWSNFRGSITYSDFLENLKNKQRLRIQYSEYENPFVLDFSLTGASNAIKQVEDHYGITESIRSWQELCPILEKIGEDCDLAIKNQLKN